MESLREHNKSFETLLSLIPIQYYFHQSDKDLDEKYFKNKKSSKKEKELKKNEQKINRHNSLKNKLNPESNSKTIQDLKLEKSSEIDDGSSLQDLAETQFDDSNNNDDIDIANNGNSAEVKPMPSSTNIEDLRSRLHSKLKGFQRKREGVKPDDDSKDALLEERRHKRTQMRQQQAQQNKKPTEKEKQALHNIIDNKPSKGKAKEGVEDNNQNEDTLQFSKLQKFSSNDDTSKSGKRSLPSDPKQALQQLEAKKAKINSLDPEKKKEVEESNLWKSVEAKASGEKVLDDEQKLKKQVKRKEKQKAKSSKDWLVFYFLYKIQFF